MAGARCAPQEAGTLGQEGLQKLAELMQPFEVDPDRHAGLDLQLFVVSLHDHTDNAIDDSLYLGQLSTAAGGEGLHFA